MRARRRDADRDENQPDQRHRDHGEAVERLEAIDGGQGDQHAARDHEQPEIAGDSIALMRGGAYRVPAEGDVQPEPAEMDERDVGGDTSHAEKAEESTDKVEERHGGGKKGV